MSGRGLYDQQIRRLTGLFALLPALACGGGSAGAALTAENPLHLEDFVDVAVVEGSEAPAKVPPALEWRFEDGETEWMAFSHHEPSIPPLVAEVVDGAYQVRLTEANNDPRGWGLHGEVYVELPELRRADWSHILIRARADGGVAELGVGFNLRRADEEPTQSFVPTPWQFWGEDADLIRDGSVHTYRLRADWSPAWFGPWHEPWRELAIALNAGSPGSIEILSITLVPKAAVYAEEPLGVTDLSREQQNRRSLFVHAPSRVSYRVRVPEGGRLDVGLGVLREDEPVTFRVEAIDDGAAANGGQAEVLFERTYEEAERWGQISVDLSAFAGRAITLTLATDSKTPGTVAFWGSPIVSRAPGAAAGPRRKPNIIFYVIDGGGADYMSAYGYNRRTTPEIAALAAEGALFERAFSNAAWTKPSTASFMTSLHSSVLGGYRTDNDAIPVEAVTMAERFRDAGYETAAFTSNPFALTLSDLQRGLDLYRDAGAEPNSAASAELHEEYWRWREAYPGQPYWAHFQTTDVHEPHEPVGPFAGLYVTPARRDTFVDWWRRLRQVEGPSFDNVLVFYRERLETMGVDPKVFFATQRDLYDETMAHNDHQLGRLIDRLKAQGEWENTILVIGADHGHPAGSFSRFGRGLLEPQPADDEGALFDSYRSRIPLIFVWPGHIRAGRRFSKPVSMIDVLPTLLDLVGLPQPEILQGRSLAPLLLGEVGEEEWEERPVIFDQFQADLETGELTGHIEVVDGRWGASMAILPSHWDEDGTAPPIAGGWRAARPLLPDMPPVLLYDLWNDPFATANVNDEHPELVETYTEFLEQQWEAHQLLARRFTAGGEVELTPEQLETLRSLGYIQ
ncbi:MAG: sulfatase [Gemmatimonadota bacterium]